MVYIREEKSVPDENLPYMPSSDEETNEELKPIYGPQGKIRQNNGWAFNFIYGRDDSEARSLGLFKVGQTTQFPLFDTGDLSLAELKSKLKEVGFEEINGMFITFDEELAQKILIGGRYSSEKASQQAAKFQAHWVVLAVKSDGSGFTDKQFHIHLDPFNVPHAGETEWFSKNSAQLVSALGQFIRGEELSLEYADSLERITADSLTRPQKEGASFLEKHLLMGDSVLLDCVMRYGKTITTLFAIREVWLHNRKVMKSALVLSHVTITSGGWLEDALKVFKSSEVSIYSQQGIPSNLKGKGYPIFNDFSKAEEDAKANSKLLLVFNSLQQAKNQKETDFLLNREWSVRVVDEAHRGTRSEKSQALYGRIRYRASIEVSGTPFNLASDYQKDKVFSFNYFDELREKIFLSECDSDSLSVSEQRMLQLPELALHVLDCRNAFKLPKTQDELMNIFSEVKLNDEAGEELLEKLQNLQDQVDKGEISNKDAENRFAELTKNSNGKMQFRYEDDVKDFFRLIRNGGENRTFPYRWQQHFDHSVIFMPSAISALALKNLLEELSYTNPVTGDIERYYDHKIIATVYGEATKEKDSSGKRKFASDLDSVKDAIANNPRTITIDYNKMGTGVTIPEWSAVFMLNNSVDAKRYLQQAFRAKTPATIDGRVKEREYVFDVNSERLYNIVNQLSVWGDGKTSQDKLRSVIRYLGITKETFGGFSDDYATEWKFETVTYSEIFEEVNRQFFEAISRNNYGELDLSLVDFQPDKSDLSLFKGKKASKKKGTSIPPTDPGNQRGLFLDIGLGDNDNKDSTTDTNGKESEDSTSLTRKRELDLRIYVNKSLPFIPFILFMADVDYTKILDENGIRENEYRTEIDKVSPDLLLDYLGPRGTKFFTDIFYKIPTHELILAAWIKGLKEIQLDSKTELEKVAAVQEYLDSLAGLRPDPNFVFTPTKVAKLLVDNFSIEDYATPGKLILDIGGKEGAPLIEMYRRILNVYGEASLEANHFKNTVSSLAMNAKGYQILKRIYRIFGWNEGGILYAARNFEATFGMNLSEVSYLKYNHSHEVVKRLQDMILFEENSKGDFGKNLSRLRRQLEVYIKSLSLLAETNKSNISTYAKREQRVSKQYKDLTSTLNNYLTRVQPQDTLALWCLENLTNNGTMNGQEIIQKAEEIVNSVTQETTVEDIKKALSASTAGDFKFSVVIGNPPYQNSGEKRNGGDTSDSNIFHEFYDVGRAVSVHLSLVFPGGRWIHRSKGCESIANLIYKSVNVINWYPNGDKRNTPDETKKLFPDVGIVDGVAIVYSDNSFPSVITLNGVEFPRPREKEILPLPAELSTIVKKTVLFGEETANTKTITRTFFGIYSSFTEKHPEAVSSIHQKPVFSNPVKSWLADNASGKAKRVKEYWLDSSFVEWTPQRREIFSKWKVVGSQGNVSKYPDAATYHIIDNEHLVGETWMIFGTFDTENEAKAFQLYLRTNFAKALLRASSGGKLGRWGVFLPLQDFTVNSIIDWSKSVEDINQQLYKKYGFTTDEISQIEDIVGKS